MKERKSFQDLPGDENPQFLENGQKIYLQLREKYPNNTVEDLDNILNSLCTAMLFLVLNNVEHSDRKNFLQLIWKILNKNI